MWNERHIAYAQLYDSHNRYIEHILHFFLRSDHLRAIVNPFPSHWTIYFVWIAHIAFAAFAYVVCNCMFNVWRRVILVWVALEQKYPNKATATFKSWLSLVNYNVAYGGTDTSPRKITLCTNSFWHGRYLNLIENPKNNFCSQYKYLLARVKWNQFDSVHSGRAVLYYSTLIPTDKNIKEKQSSQNEQSFLKLVGNWFSLKSGKRTLQFMMCLVSFCF